MSTVRERKLARNPRRRMRASSRNTPAMMASMPASATYCGEPAAASGVRAGEHDGRRGGVGPDDEVPRRAEDGEQGQRDQDRVQAGDHRHPGDLGVAHHLGDGERRQRDAGDDLGRHAALADRQQALEQRHGKAPPLPARVSRHRAPSGRPAPASSLAGPPPHRRCILPPRRWSLIGWRCGHSGGPPRWWRLSRDTPVSRCCRPHRAPSAAQAVKQLPRSLHE